MTHTNANIQGCQSLKNQGINYHSSALAITFNKMGPRQSFLEIYNIAYLCSPTIWLKRDSRLMLMVTSLEQAPCIVLAGHEEDCPCSSKLCLCWRGGCYKKILMQCTSVLSMHNSRYAVKYTFCTLCIGLHPLG
jgi:hypothetical protein